MPAYGLGRDATRTFKCLYKGRERECPIGCERCGYPLRMLADAALRNGDVVMCIVLYRKALEFTPDYPDVWNNLANVLASAMHYSEALEAFERALALDPAYGKAMRGRATALRHLMRYDEALDQIEALLSLYADERSLRERDEILAQLDLRSRPLRRAGEDTLRLILSHGVSEGIFLHDSAPYVRRVWDRAEVTAAGILSMALEQTAQPSAEGPSWLQVSSPSIGRRDLRQALSFCFWAGMASLLINDRVDEHDLQAADYDHTGFLDLLTSDWPLGDLPSVTVSLILADKVVMQALDEHHVRPELTLFNGQADMLARIALDDYDDRLRQLDRQGRFALHDEILPSDYFECARALFLAGACRIAHLKDVF
ncbi:MAG: tetratricopeptide repeat protein [Paludibacteraceae bacterium]|nr:tetratricopeptide repeat protein [Paludibacteraceae bacterium]